MNRILIAVLCLCSTLAKAQGVGHQMVEPVGQASAQVPRSLRDALIDCEEKPDTCKTLSDFATTHPVPYAQLHAWCGERRLPSEIVKADSKAPELHEAARYVCHYVRAPGADRTTVGRERLIEFRLASDVRPRECGGFGLMLPAIGIRPVGGREAFRFIGPGGAIGGGYYHPVTCDREQTFGIDAYAFTEGLNPGDRVQAGVALGVSLRITSVFRVGLAAGFDVVNLETDESGQTRGTGLYRLDTPSDKAWYDVTAMPAFRHTTMVYFLTLNLTPNER